MTLLSEKDATATAIDAPITRLPPYFPTTVKQCAEPTEKFFCCFEQNAVMATPTDTKSAKRALLLCQQELLGYTTCMEKHLIGSKKRTWWQLW